MKVFYLYRTEDQSGVSGTGPVVEGVQFTNGWCAIRWLTETSSICFYKSIADVKRVHGHGGKTELIMHDFGGGGAHRPESSRNLVYRDALKIIEDGAVLATLAEQIAENSAEELLAVVRDIRNELDTLEKRVIERQKKAV